VEPEYPRSAFARGIEDTIPIRVLVCRSGRVLDAWALPSFRGFPTPDAEPIEYDPKLVEAALAAVRQYVFSPGIVGGNAVAVHVETQVAFRR
jgi:outer membrane biosynthesis protein TonB